MNYKRGMLKFHADNIPLKFSSYVKHPHFHVPAVFGHVGRAQPPVSGGWGMLGNDTHGDCTVAGIAHGQMVWDWATNKAIPTFTSAGIIQQYFALTGGPDSGLNPIDVATYFQQTGLMDAHGVAHKIDAATAITNTNDLVSAAYLFGFSGLGLQLPDSAEQQFSDGDVWDDVTSEPDPNEGHFVPVVGRNSKGNIVVVTWGGLQAMTPAYLDRYFAGGVGYISEDYFTDTGKSPEGFDFAQLSKDLQGMV